MKVKYAWNGIDEWCIKHQIERQTQEENLIAPGVDDHVINKNDMNYHDHHHHHDNTNNTDSNTNNDILSKQLFLQKLNLSSLHPFCNDTLKYIYHTPSYELPTIPSQGSIISNQSQQSSFFYHYDDNNNNDNNALYESIITTYTMLIPPIIAITELWIRLFAFYIAIIGIIYLSYQQQQQQYRQYRQQQQQQQQIYQLTLKNDKSNCNLNCTNPMTTNTNTNTKRL